MRVSAALHSAAKASVAWAEHQLTYRSETVGDFVADNINTTVSGNGDNRLQVAEIDT